MTQQKKPDPENINVNGFAYNHLEISDILKNRQRYSKWCNLTKTSLQNPGPRHWQCQADSVCHY